MLGRVVAGKEVPIACAGGTIIGRLIFQAKVAPIAGGVAIKAVGSGDGSLDADLAASFFDDFF